MMFTYFEYCQQSSKTLFFIYYNGTSIPNSLYPPRISRSPQHSSPKGDRHYHESALHRPIFGY
ncbi:MAG: hypothetical protein ACK5X7_02095 [Pseudanabaena sp.]